MSIRETGAQIKGFVRTIGSEWLVALIVVLVGISGFILGFLAASGDNTYQVTIRKKEPKEGQIAALGGLLVASRNGSKYHFPWCGGAQRIAERNIIWFKDEEEARRLWVYAGGQLQRVAITYAAVGSVTLGLLSR